MTSNQTKWQSVFLDRDGVVTPKLGSGEYLLSEQGVVLNSGTTEALGRLQELGIQLFIVSNQSCVARGLVCLSDVERIHKAVIDLLKAEGISITDSRVCAHDDRDNCLCRKPKPGMILELCAAYKIDPAQSAMVGDSMTDIQAGQAAGCRELCLIGSAQAGTLPENAKAFNNVKEAVDHLLVGL